MATRSSFLAWRIPWTEDPGGLQSWGRKEKCTIEQLNTIAILRFYGLLSLTGYKLLKIVESYGLRSQTLLDSNSSLRSNSLALFHLANDLTSLLRKYR